MTKYLILQAFEVHAWIQVIVKIHGNKIPQGNDDLAKDLVVELE
jgi:hypothetical protein